MPESQLSNNLAELAKLSKYLTETESQLSAFWLICPDLKVVAKDGKFVKVSPSWTKVLGYTGEELMSMDYETLVHPDDLQDTQEVKDHLDNNCIVSNFCNRYKHKFEDRWVTIEWSAKKDLSSGLTYASGVDKSKELHYESIIKNLPKVDTQT